MTLRHFPPHALQAWLGHRNIQHTVRYTELAPGPGLRTSGPASTLRGKN